MKSYCLVLAFVASCFIFLIAWLVCAESPAPPQTPLPTNTTSSELYTALLNLRNAELAALWSRFNIHLAINIGLLFAVLTARSDSGIVHLHKLPYVFGLVATIIWLASELVGRYSLHVRDAALGRFEAAYFPEPLGKHAQFIRFADLPWWNPFVQPLRAQMLVSLFLILILGLVWVSLLVRPEGDSAPLDPLSLRERAPLGSPLPPEG